MLLSQILTHHEPTSVVEGSLNCNGSKPWMWKWTHSIGTTLGISYLDLLPISSLGYNGSSKPNMQLMVLSTNIKLTSSPKGMPNNRTLTMGRHLLHHSNVDYLHHHCPSRLLSMAYLLDGHQIHLPQRPTSRRDLHRTTPWIYGSPVSYPSHLRKALYVLK